MVDADLAEVGFRPQCCRLILAVAYLQRHHVRSRPILANLAGSDSRGGLLFGSGAYRFGGGSEFGGGRSLCLLGRGFGGGHCRRQEWQRLILGRHHIPCFIRMLVADEG